MKYQVILDKEYILYDLRQEELTLENPELDLTVSKVGKLSFSIYPDHPYFDLIQKKSSKIEVIKNGKTIFRGRIIEDEQGLYNNKKILCESALAYLNDSIVRPNAFSGSPLEFLTMILNNHNSQVSLEQQLKLGNVTVIDANNYISRNWTDYISSWETLEKRGIELIGGYIVERYEADGTYIDWLEDFDDTSTQVIEFGENIVDILAKNNASQTYSVVIPLGVETENEDGTKTRLTIESVNDGKDYLVNQDALDKYGWIVAPVTETTWDDVTLASNLKTKGSNWLDNQGVMIKSEFEITALDLQATDKNIESFFYGEYVEIKSKPHNINEVLLLSSIKIPLAHPENTKITVGKETNTLTGIQLGTGTKIDNVINRVNVVEKNYTINNEKLNDLEKAIEYFSVDLSQYNLTIPTDSNKKPLETKNYDIYFYGYYKGQQVTPNVSISGSNTGITTSKTNTYLRFAVSNSTAITNLSNEYTITFTYVVDGISYKVVKKVNIVLALKGADGQNGSQGKNGADGKSAYQIWLDAGNTGTEEEYLASLKGEQGEAGQKGKDGVTYYTWVKYADTPTLGMSNDSTNKAYIGIAYNKTTATESTNYNDYEWTLIKGADGQKGQDGAKGADGISVVSIENYYAINTSNTTAPTTGWNKTIPTRVSGQYLWVKELITFSDNSSEYTTAFVVTGDKGEQGIQGPQGPQGIQGATGKDGTSYYFYVRYSINSNGNPMTTAPTTASKYMGVASTTSSTAPTSYSAYTWSLIKGADGQNGSPGQAGADGKSSYLHIKYSDDGTTFTANNGEAVGRYRGELVDNNPTDSTTFSAYTWYDMALIVEDELNAIREEVQTNLTSIQQNQEEILMTALKDYVATSDYETFRETISTMIKQTNDNITFSFNNLQETISTIDGDIQRQFQEQSKYIRFDGGISLGELGNEVTLRIENDIIKFVVGNSSVLEITPNGIVAPKIRTKEVEYTPFRLYVETDGSLTLDMVGDN